MKHHGPKTFGELNAGRYDGLTLEAMAQETAASVQILFELADGGKVLELAIGTGRVALPLAATGLTVHGIDAARFEIAIHDAVTQTVAFQRIIISEKGTTMTPHYMRYAWPSELDLMAQLAGLQRRERWAWWDRSPFTAGSKSHVTLYARAPSQAVL